MLLAIDARNSSVNFGIHADGQWLSIIRLSTDRSSDEYALLMRSAFERIPGLKISRAFLSSVVPTLTPRLQRAIQTAFQLDARVIGPGIKTGLRIRTDVPSELGSDIVCSAVAARALQQETCIVVDFSTAISVTAISRSADLLGVAIAPGMEAAVRGLRSATAQLPDIPLELPPACIGKTTVRSVQSGLFFGYSGLVKALLDSMRSELGQEAFIVATGNDYGKIVLSRLSLDSGTWRFVPDLALEGLACIAALNS